MDITISLPDDAAENLMSWRYSLYDKLKSVAIEGDDFQTMTLFYPEAGHLLCVLQLIIEADWTLDELRKVVTERLGVTFNAKIFKQVLKQVNAWIALGAII